MSWGEQPARASLPGAEVPSAEVLDELLRAFSADVTDQGRLDRVDLASPEVEELLTPSGESAPPVAEVADDAVTVANITENSESRQEVETSDDQDRDPAAALAGDPADEPAKDGSAAPATEPATEPAGEPDQPGETVDPPAPPKTIVIDSAHDPPDAVYLAAGDPLLRRPVGGDVAHAAEPSDTSGPADTTIFIDDRPTGQTISLEAATSATRIEPRMRERRIAVRRAVGRKRLRWVLVAAIVFVVVVGALAVLGSSLFAIDHVEVEGAVYTDQAALDAVVEELEGTPVLRADTDRAERALESIPWVEDARVTTEFPHGAKIEIRERTPVATFEGSDGAFRVIDTHGRVLDVLDGQPVEYLLLLSADAPAVTAGQFAPQGFGAAASLVQALTPELRARAQSVAVTPDGSDLRLMLNDGIEVRFGAARDLVVKLVRLQTSVDDLDGGPLSYVDVSTNEVTTG